MPAKTISRRVLNAYDGFDRLNSCSGSVKWVRLLVKKGWGPQRIWNACERGDWLLWLIQMCGDRAVPHP